MDDDDDADMAYCPECGAQVYQFADRCPHCGQWITPKLRPPSRSLGWRVFVIIIVVILIYALLRRYWPF